MTQNVDKTTKKQLGGVTGKGFMPGQSGNPLGRPKGTFSFKTMITNELEANPELASEICHYYLHDKRMRELLWKMIDGMPQGSQPLIDARQQTINITPNQEQIDAGVLAELRERKHLWEEVRRIIG